MKAVSHPICRLVILSHYVHRALLPQSYAGVYVPSLANEIRVSNAAGTSKLNLQGFMVGNGCTGSEVGVCSPKGTKISGAKLTDEGNNQQHLLRVFSQSLKNIKAIFWSRIREIF